VKVSAGPEDVEFATLRGDSMDVLLDFTEPHVLRNEKEYAAAIREIERLLDEDPQAGSTAHERLEFLSVLVEEYEDRVYPMDAVSPQQAVSFMLEQKGMARSELSELMGGSSRVSDFFSGKRDLSKTQVQALRVHLGIPADILLGLSDGPNPGDL
jgi:HTH-type transcriptional regulator / antitoxin HigA